MEISFYPGQKITTYYAGYFEVTRIVRRWLNKTMDTDFSQYAYCICGEFTDECGKEMNPIIYFKQIFDGKGNPKKSKEKGCDMQYCNPAEESIQKEINKYTEILNKLTNLKSQLS